MLIAPIIFLTVVIGICSMGDVKKVGKIRGKALLYFEIVSTFALEIGLLVVNIVKPGEGFDTGAANGADVSQYTQAVAAEHGIGAFVMQIIPDNVVGALANGELLLVLFSAILFGIAATAIGEPAKPVITFFERVADIFCELPLLINLTV